MSEEKKYLEGENSFLGRGWSFPVTFSKSSRSVQLSEDENDIRESLIILLTTIKGERVLRPDFGSRVSTMIFEPLTTMSAALLTEEIRKAVLYFESRVDLNDVKYQQDINKGYILIMIEYTIVSTNTRTNLVYPFYFREGTDVSI